MNEKDFYVKINEQHTDCCRNTLTNSRRLCVEGHKKLESEFQQVIFNLSSAIKKAKICRETLEKKATKKDILLADHCFFQQWYHLLLIKYRFPVVHFFFVVKKTG